ncbi:MAG: CRISPR-associated endonuclease Cas2 [Longicatena caecimuris]|uniref:CRISPR-associated endonuclease Cas2 n=1 Tax=Longicatena TaxID=1918536 RepID=UPI0002FFF613|nr:MULTISPECIES: CRISPR-associated endonuclease Cas2 [Longicatena]MBS4976273.1 CRISPR-associated endonuclease Cas2 [Eubacterium sp.]RJV80176.1 CRISPR-associated endonuclease Cas2 [Eubacterium sp. AF19-17]RJW00593.1 CRISPR-associated endonuclease Cas2 [Eubacterium sp. AM35-6AC]RJW46382.1 CRISPR-associated endonuclease Cas2 [Eubacterium sp. OF10-16]MCB5395289.1 CRISPR-associated endonuclease Cas2 [Longicatena caecimuris]
MMVLITYDVNTEDKAGRKRLRKVAKHCLNYGLRVQNSVFECNVNQKEYVELQHVLSTEIDESKDSLRFYLLGNNYKNKIIHIGAKPTFDVTEPLIF